MDVLDTLKARLSEHQPRDLPPHPHRRAAVLIPLHAWSGLPVVLLTRRTETVEHHKGQIAFPGGREEEGDSDLLTTALRETEEEIGLPARDIEVWGRLDEVETVVSGFAITPYVGFLPRRVELTANPEEIEAMVTVPLGIFLDPANLRVEHVQRDGHLRELLFYDFPPHVVWGVTARIMRNLVGLLSPGSSATRPR